MNSFRCHRKLIINSAFTVAFASLSAGAASAQEVALPPVAPQEEAKPVQHLPQGATLDGAREKVSKISSEGVKSLEKLMGGSVSPRSSAEVGAMADKKRSIMMLQLQKDEAKLAKELWLELEGDKSESKAEIDQLKQENDQLKASLETAQKTASQPAGIPISPVVTEIVGAAGGMKASVFYPGAGVVQATPGVILPNGMKVVSVSSKGVVVEDMTGRKTLGFGGASN